MIRPLDLQVAWKSLPVQANRVLQEQASSLYRSMQDMNESYSRNIQQTKTISKISESAGSLLASIQKSDIKANYRLEELKQRWKGSRGKGRYPAYLSFPQGKGKEYFSSESYGNFLNLRA